LRSKPLIALVLALAAHAAGAQTLSPAEPGGRLTLDILAALRDGAEDEIIVGLVLDGAALDVATPAMQTPLHLAAASTGDPELIGLMIARGADPAARDASGRTPLHEAAARNPNVGVTAALAGLGAPLGARDAAGETPLHAAARAAATAAAALLVLVGADACARDAAGRPALDAATLERVRMQAPDAYPAVRDAFLDCL
jgi:ankyrin repeat protein